VAVGHPHDHHHGAAAGAHSHHHAHTVSAETDRGKLIVALAILLAFMVAEVVAGLLASSVALLTDAAHMLTDVAAIGLSLVALSLAARPPAGAMTFGLKRAEPLSALVNGVTLLVLGIVFAGGAISRLVSPVEVEGGLVLAVALIGIPVNLAATWTLSQADRRSVNVEGAFQHVLTDLYAFIATAIAAAVILATGFDRADPIAALVVAALMLRSAYGLLRSSGRIFLEAAPEGVDPDEIGMALAGAPTVVSVHDLHVWEVTSGFPALSAHVVVGADEDCHATRARLEELLRDRFGIDHSTLQVEHEPRTLLSIDPGP
jgi:cobalt-zinc-cadmium efflux system protein